MKCSLQTGHGVLTLCKMQIEHKMQIEIKTASLSFLHYVTLLLSMSRNRFFNCQMYLVLYWYNAIIFSICGKYFFLSFYISFFNPFSLTFFQFTKDTLTSPLLLLTIPFGYLQYLVYLCNSRFTATAEEPKVICQTTCYNEIRVGGCLVWEMLRQQFTTRGRRKSAMIDGD